MLEDGGGRAHDWLDNRSDKSLKLLSYPQSDIKKAALWAAFLWV
jgi:hypothetical protein